MLASVWRKTTFADGTRPAYIEMLSVCDSLDNPLDGAVMQFVCNEAIAGNPAAVELRSQMIANHRNLMAHHIGGKSNIKPETLIAASKALPHI